MYLNSEEIEGMNFKFRRIRKVISNVIISLSQTLSSQRKLYFIGLYLAQSTNKMLLIITV